MDDYIESQTLDLTSSPFTIEAWFKMPTVNFQNNTNIIDNYETNPSTDKRWGIYIGGTEQTWTGKVAWRGDLFSTVRVDDDQWHHIAVVRDVSGTVNLFIDGNLDASGSLPLDYDLNAGHTIKIGSGHNFFGQRFMNCKISELQVSLNAKYSSNFAPSTLIETDANSILHYDFNQGYGSIVEDLSASGNDGTIYGDTQWSDDVPEVSNSGGLVASTFYTPSDALEDNNLYYWNVSVTDQLGLSYTTPTQTFVVNTQDDLPSDFALLSPENESMVANLSPSFFWDESFDIDYLGSVIGYDFYIGTSNDLSDVTPIQVNTNSYTLQSQLEEDQIYYWKVAAISDNGLETLSECWSFYTNSENSAPSEFSLVSPEHQSEVTTLQPLLNWSESNDPDLYDNLSYNVLYGLDPNNLVEYESGNSSGSFPVVFEPSENDVLVETLDLAFTSFQQIESTPLDAGTNYYLKISGSYSISNGHAGDAAYYYDASWCTDETCPILAMPWTWNGESGQLPSPADYNQDHIYFYYFTGERYSEVFAFEDGGGYGDNSGSLNIEIYEMENQSDSNYSLRFDGNNEYIDQTLMN